MARPKTKEELIHAANSQYEKLFTLIHSMSDVQQLAPFDFNESSLGKEAHWMRDKNIRDVIIHLYEWHQLVIQWITSNLKGETKSFLPKPYNWKTYGVMNIEFFNKHQGTSYELSKELLQESHTKVVELINSFTNEELFVKQHFSWTGTTTLGSYCVSSTSSHYDWAIKKVKKHIKNIEKKKEYSV